MDSVGPVTRSRARASAPSTPAGTVAANTPVTRRSTRRAQSTKDVAAAPEPEPEVTQLFKDAEVATDAVKSPEVQAAADGSAWQDSETVFSINGSMTPWVAKRAATPAAKAATPGPVGTPTPLAAADGVVDFVLSPEAAKEGSADEQDLASLQDDSDLIEEAGDLDNNLVETATPSAGPIPTDFSFDVTIPEAAMDIVDVDTSTPTLLTPPKETAPSSPAAASPASDRAPGYATYVVSRDGVNLSGTPAFTRTTPADFIDAATPVDSAYDHHTGHVYHGIVDEAADSMDDDVWSEDGTCSSDETFIEKTFIKDDCFSAAGTPLSSPQADPATPSAATADFSPSAFPTPVASAMPLEEVEAAFEALQDEELDEDDMDITADSPVIGNLGGALALASTDATPAHTGSTTPLVATRATPMTSSEPLAPAEEDASQTPAVIRTPLAAATRSAKTPATAPAGSRPARLAKTPNTAVTTRRGEAESTGSASKRMLDVLSDISGSAANNRQLPAYMRPTQASSIKAQTKVQSSPLKAQVENVATDAVAMKPKLKSVVVAEGYDSRSIRQLRKEIKVAAANRVAKEASQIQVCGADEIRKKPSNEEDWEVEETIDTVLLADDGSDDDEEVQGGLQQECDVTCEMGRLGLMPLHGVPAAQGKHIRFGDNLTPIASPSNGKTLLRGVPVAGGQHLRFDE